MPGRCIFVAFLLLLSGCETAPGQADAPALAPPPENRIIPRLPRSDAGLPASWFAGTWRMGASACLITLDPADETGQTGSVSVSNCSPPWAMARQWRSASDGVALFEIVDDRSRRIWRALVIQPTALVGESGEGQPVRLYWADEGVHGGWVQPSGETAP